MYRDIRLKKNISGRCDKGFTIIELMIVVGIMAIITVLVLYNSKGLNNSIMVSNTAYEVGLMVREAQTYGLGVRATDNSMVGFSYSQGIHFDSSTNEANTVVLFSDKDNNGQWSGSNENIQVFTISKERAGSILSLCVLTGGTSCTVVGTADVLFKRPNPESVLYTNPLPAGGSASAVVVNIGFTPGNGECRSIIVQKSGSVQIDKTYCPN